MSRSRWRRSRSRETSSPTFCGSSLNCGRRQSRQPYEVFGVTRLSNSQETCALVEEDLVFRTFDAASAGLDVVRRRAGGGSAAGSGLQGTRNGRRFGLKRRPSGGSRNNRGGDMSKTL